MRSRARATCLAIVLLLLLSGPLAAARKEEPKAKAKREGSSKKDEGPLVAGTFSGLALRGIGPALTSGRIADIAVHPRNTAQYFLAVASGGVWKTVNAGTTWTPVFDSQGSYSIGCVTIDPHDPLTVWVGTGENNSQRSVSYGDGVYKSTDGGTTWKRMGLEHSEHISRIVVDPRGSDTVWVAAQGPLWNAGGERGLYKTTDGGATWKLSLEIGENTGVTDVVLDPRDPDVVYAAAYQRRRHVFTLIDGGPESAIYKSNDGGASWRKLEQGLPKVDLGRIGLAISPARPDTVYAIVEAEGEEGGFFRSTDAGGNWEKRSSYVASSPMYYNEIVADPLEPNRVYSLDTFLNVTEDGGKSFARVGNRARHVDDHALWIDAADTDHLRVGCDGGLYESWDRGQNWEFKANLPVTQFYRVTVDNAEPFYNVYGGTQDNFTLGGPSRTTSASGIGNADWFVALGGDGFEPQVDPQNPDIVYAQLQYGELARFDKRSGEILSIQPQAAPGDDPLRWNWDSPLIISPHAPTRLYFAAQRVFRSDDRGETWTAISDDLTRGTDRNQLEVMGRVQKVDAVAKGASTSFYGNIVSLCESPRVEGLLYAGTDDGLVRVREPGSEAWQRIERVHGVPETTYVSDLEPSRHADDRVFAAFDNHKNGDFEPYLLRSDDRGRSWTSIAGDLPERGTVYTVVEDHERPELLFAGTEFGVYFTLDGGARWIRLEGGMPIIAVRDLEIQRRENDLVVGTFGRGIYILDDYTPLRHVDRARLERGAMLFPVKDAWMYVPSRPLGLPGKAFLGDGHYIAPNPPFGAIFTYYLDKEIVDRKKARHEKEKEDEKAKKPYRYPSWDELRAEEREEGPAVLLTVRDADGVIVRQLTGPPGKGFQRVAWDLRLPAVAPVQLEEAPPGLFDDVPLGPLVLPGEYTVHLSKVVDSVETRLGEPQKVVARPLGLATLGAADRGALLAFQRKTARLQRAVLGASEVAGETARRIDHLQKALLATPGSSAADTRELRELQDRLRDVQLELDGDRLRQRYNEPAPPSISERVNRIVNSQWTSSAAPTATNREAYEFAAAAFAPVLSRLRELIEVDLARIERELESAGAPWTPGRVPTWRKE
jgi:photosystem II stability/assembly factor-like uncharacterized protein